MHMVAEGVKSAPVVMALAHEHGIEMPIANQVHKVLYEGHTAQDAYRGLLGRDHIDEMYGMQRPRRR